MFTGIRVLFRVKFEWNSKLVCICDSQVMGQANQQADEDYNVAVTDKINTAVCFPALYCSVLVTKSWETKSCVDLVGTDLTQLCTHTTGWKTERLQCGRGTNRMVTLHKEKACCLYWRTHSQNRLIFILITRLISFRKLSCLPASVSLYHYITNFTKTETFLRT
jgi:hypothetical protein